MTKSNLKSAPKAHERILHWLDDHRGIYIPRDFANSFNEDFIQAHVEGATQNDFIVLAYGPGGMLDDDTPEHIVRAYQAMHPNQTPEYRGELYWNTWSDMCRDAKLYLDRPNNPTSQHYWTIHQDGSCFLIRNDVEHCDRCDGWKDADAGCPHTGEGHDEPDEHGFQVGQSVRLTPEMIEMGWTHETGTIEDVTHPETSPYLIRWPQNAGNGSTCLKVHRAQLILIEEPE